jgi:hypothetical protein
MPVVLVSAAPCASVVATRTMLAQINRAVASGLGLAPHDVYATFTATPVAMLGDGPVEPWPIAILHGSARAPERMAAALDGVRAVLAQTYECATDSVWAQWNVAS